MVARSRTPRPYRSAVFRKRHKSGCLPSRFDFEIPDRTHRCRLDRHERRIRVEHQMSGISCAAAPPMDGCSISCAALRDRARNCGSQRLTPKPATTRNRLCNCHATVRNHVGQLRAQPFRRGPFIGTPGRSSCAVAPLHFRRTSQETRKSREDQATGFQTVARLRRTSSRSAA